MHHPEAGGSEKYLVEVAKGLADRGHDVTFRTARYAGSEAEEVVDGVRYVRRGGRYSLYAACIAERLLRRHRDHDVVVDVQNGVPFLSPLAPCRSKVINLVHHVHREQWPVIFPAAFARVGWFLESRVAPRVYRRCSYVTVSDSTFGELGELGVDTDHVSVIPNGTDATFNGTAKTDHPVIVVLGRLVPHKRVELAIEAVADIATDIPDVELRVVGSGYWEPELRAKAAELGVSDRVTFVGHVSEEEKHEHLAQAWVLALPSLKEGWGLVIVEAGVHGTPSVAFTEAGGPRDAIRDGETGLLVDGGSQEFAAALRSVLVDDALRDRLSQAVIGWVNRFRWPQAVSRWEALMHRVASGDNRRLVASAVTDTQEAAVPEPHQEALRAG